MTPDEFETLFRVIADTMLPNRGGATDERRRDYLRLKAVYEADEDLKALFLPDMRMSLDDYRIGTPAGDPGRGDIMGIDEWARPRRRYLAVRAERERERAALASSWTGITSPAEKARAVYSLVPPAREAIQRIIQEIEARAGNGGPLIDETQDALFALRELHAALGELLEWADAGATDIPLALDKVGRALGKLKRDAKANGPVLAAVFLGAAILDVLHTGGALSGAVGWYLGRFSRDPP